MMQTPRKIQVFMVMVGLVVVTSLLYFLPVLILNNDVLSWPAVLVGLVAMCVFFYASHAKRERMEEKGTAFPFQMAVLLFFIGIIVLGIMYWSI